jgi:hypothetical protein
MGRDAMYKKYGPDAMKKAGKVGGTNLWIKRGPEYMRQLGRKGAETTMRRYGYEHMRRISARGGQRLKDLVTHGKAFEMGYSIGVKP